MSLSNIFSSGQISRTRRKVVRVGAEDETIKSIIGPELTELDVQEEKRAWIGMCER